MLTALVLGEADAELGTAEGTDTAAEDVETKPKVEDELRPPLKALLVAGDGDWDCNVLPS